MNSLLGGDRNGKYRESAIKRVKTTEKAEARNISQKSAMRTAVKNAKTSYFFQ